MDYEYKESRLKSVQEIVPQLRASFYLCDMNRIRIAIFASGTGSNAVNLIRHFSGHDRIEVALVYSNKPEAAIVEAARRLGVDVEVSDNALAADPDFLLDLCARYTIDWIVLAGYLRLIPPALIQHYDARMINLHPSLLPKFGGKGMYSHHVHEAVLAQGERHTGITIHFVNEQFDKGEIIAQFHTPVSEGATLAEVEASIRYLEQSYLPLVVERTILR